MLCRCYRYAVFTTLLGVAVACFLGPRAEGATVRGYSAFLVGHPVKTREPQLRMLMRSAITNDEYDGTSKAHVESTRRECIERSFLQASRVMGIVATAPWNKISVANAATVTITEQAVSKSWLCDPAVSSWSKKGRTVHIVGTAHISSVSADLAGNVVREVQVRVCNTIVRGVSCPVPTKHFFFAFF